MSARASLAEASAKTTLDSLRSPWGIRRGSAPGRGAEPGLEPRQVRRGVVHPGADEAELVVQVGDSPVEARDQAPGGLGGGGPGRAIEGDAVDVGQHAPAT